MNLHTITIRTTIITLVASFLMAFAYFFASANYHDYDFSPLSVTMNGVLAGVAGLFCSAPLLVSWIVLRFLKHSFALILLLLSTIAYGLGMSYALYESWGNYGFLGGILFIAWPAGWFLCMIPVWNIALLLNWLLLKRASVQRLASEPKMEGESFVG